MLCAKNKYGPNLDTSPKEIPISVTLLFVVRIQTNNIIIDPLSDLEG